jgi:hypothetical protein
MQDEIHIWADSGTAVHVHVREQASGRPAAISEAAEPEQAPEGDLLIVYQPGGGLVGCLVVTEDGCRDAAPVGNLQA